MGRGSNACIGHRHLSQNLWAHHKGGKVPNLEAPLVVLSPEGQFEGTCGYTVLKPET